MNKVRLLTILVIALFLTNAGLLVFMKLGGNRGPKDIGPRNIIIQKLSFNDEQVVNYDKLIAQHRESIKAKEIQIKNIKQEFYKTLKTDTILNVESKYLTELCKLQSDIEAIHYSHFIEIKKLCKPNQLPAFNLLTEELAQHFTNHRKKDLNK